MPRIFWLSVWFNFTRIAVTHFEVLFVQFGKPLCHRFISEQNFCSHSVSPLLLFAKNLLPAMADKIEHNPLHFLQLVMALLVYCVLFTKFCGFCTALNYSTGYFAMSFLGKHLSFCLILETNHGNTLCSLLSKCFSVIMCGTPI